MGALRCAPRPLFFCWLGWRVALRTAPSFFLLPLLALCASRCAFFSFAVLVGALRFAPCLFSLVALAGALRYVPRLFSLIALSACEWYNGVDSFLMFR
ncbi:MAG: hypothetical protein MRZ54_02030 [Clostridiales bacterium]|nr:hypothetical protein [Clostridiales bacterium]